MRTPRLIWLMVVGMTACSPEGRVHLTHETAPEGVQSGPGLEREPGGSAAGQSAGTEPGTPEAEQQGEPIGTEMPPGSGVNPQVPEESPPVIEPVDPYPSATSMNGPIPPSGRSQAVLLEAGRAIGPTRAAGSTWRIGMNVDGTCQLGHSKYMDPLLSPYIVGISEDLFGSSEPCGMCYLMQYRGRKAVIVVGDLCPGCGTDHFDLPESAAIALNTDGKPHNMGEGLTATPVACDWKGHGLEYYFDNGSSEWNWYLLIFWNTFPLSRVIATVESTGKTFELAHDPYGRFVVAHQGKPLGSGRIELELHGQGTTEIVTDTLTWNGKPDVLVQGTGVNFKLQEPQGRTR